MCSVVSINPYGMDTIAAFLEAFEHSAYKLRIVLVERYQRRTKDDWLSNLKRAMFHDTRLAFEAGEYKSMCFATYIPSAER